MSTFAPSHPKDATAHHAAAGSSAKRRESSPPASAAPSFWTAPRHVVPLLLFWLAIFVSSLASPPLLDDADATHAQAAQAMLRTGDWVTLHVDGVRYLEKAPLPYWITALSLRVFGENAFAVHLPLSLAVLGLALLGYGWARRSFDPQTAFYTALFVLTSLGTFLFTRIFIPDALLSLLLAASLYALHLTLEPEPATIAGSPIAPGYPWMFWLCMALAVLTKGLIAIVFLLGTAALYLTLARSWSRWRALRPWTGSLILLAVAAPWHILAGLRNTGGSEGHGFFWFYFVNEHVLRFLGRRFPRDYNKLPALLYWALHLVWLFPWSFFTPAAALLLWRKRHRLLAVETRAQRTFVLMACFSALVLVFFSLSTNQEYYTFPVYLPLLMLLAAATQRTQRRSRFSGSVILSEARVPGRSMTARARHQDRTDPTSDCILLRAVHLSYVALAFTGGLLAAALAYGLWQAHRLSFVPDIGTQLGHRSIGSYTLSLSHFFDLTGASFAALRLPAAIALAVLALGPCVALPLQRKGRAQGAVITIAFTSGLFLIAAHLALCRFAPVLSSSTFADTILQAEREGRIEPGTQVLMMGDQSFGSSIPFYLHRTVQLVDGRSSSMLFGSTFPDVPPVFVSSAELAASWGHGQRKLLFVPAEQRDAANRLLGNAQLVLFQSSGKELLTDRPLRLAEGRAVISTGVQRSGEIPVSAPAYRRAHDDGNQERNGRGR